jgi:hypothetical protein
MTQSRHELGRNPAVRQIRYYALTGSVLIPGKLSLIRIAKCPNSA